MASKRCDSNKSSVNLISRKKKRTKQTRKRSRRLWCSKESFTSFKKIINKMLVAQIIQITGVISVLVENKMLRRKQAEGAAKLPESIKVHSLTNSWKERVLRKLQVDEAVRLPESIREPLLINSWKDWVLKKSNSKNMELEKTVIWLRNQRILRKVKMHSKDSL